MKSKTALVALLLVAGPAYAGREFINSEDDHLTLAATVFGSAPFTVVAWVEANDASATHNIYSEADSANATHYYQLALRGEVAGDPVRLWSDDNVAEGQADSTSGYSANTWGHAVGKEVSTTDRSAYLDGGNEGTDTTSVGTPTGLDTTQIGRFAGNAFNNPLDGTMGPISGWSSALTDAQVASLGAGRDPRTLATLPDFHLPMTGGVQQVISGGPTFTDSGTAEAGHKPLGWN